MEKEEKLKVIADKIAKCTACPLYQGTNNPVPGEGNPQAEVLFIGEGPGFNEDQRGIPFCGASGRLLDQLLELIKVERKDVFIGNVVKHRPSNNRDPSFEEIEACRPFLDEQIEIIDPKIIVTLGRFSMRKFLPDEYISKVHGQARYINFAGKRRIVIPMYHPAAALRNGNVMKEIKLDFQKISQFLNLKEAEGKEKENNNQEEQLSLIN